MYEMMEYNLPLTLIQVNECPWVLKSILTLTDIRKPEFKWAVGCTRDVHVMYSVHVKYT